MTSSGESGRSVVDPAARAAGDGLDKAAPAGGRPTDTPPSEPPPSETPPAYGQVVARGMAWTTLAVVLGRITGFAAQLILGWLLSERDFGTYAIAIGLSVIVLTLRSSGAQKLLIQRGSEYDQLAQPLARLSLAINVIALVVLLALAPTAARYYDAPGIVSLMWVIGVSLPLGVPAEIMRAKLSVDLRFGALAVLNVGSLILTQALTVLLALAGLGPLSFVLPMVVIALLESFVLWRLVGWWPQGRPLDRPLLRELGSATKWIVLCGFAAALIVQGNHLVVGKLESREVTGIFFFGFQLTTAVAMFFNTGMQRVLMPAMSRLSEQPERQAQAYLKSVRMLATVSAPVCLLGAVVAAPLMHTLWAGKWDRAIPVFQLLSGVLPLYMVTAIGAALLEAQGFWRANTWFHFLSAVGTLLSAWVGATVGGLGEIALAAALFRAAYGLFHGLSLTRLMEQPAATFLVAVVPPCLASMSVAVGVHLGLGPMLAGQAGGVQTAVLAIGFAAATGIVYATCFRSRLKEIATILKH